MISNQQNEKKQVLAETILDVELFEQVRRLSCDDEEFAVQFIERINELGISEKCKENGMTFMEYLKVKSEEEKVKQQKANKTLVTGSVTEFKQTNIELNCGRWICNETGVYRLEPSSKGKDPQEMKEIRASYQQIFPVAEIVNKETGQRTLRIMFSIKRGDKYEWKHVDVKPSICAKKTTITQLADYGIDVTDQRATALIEYFSDMRRLNVDKIQMIQAVTRLGWKDGIFYPYTKGVELEAVDDMKSLISYFREEGSRDVWITECKKYRRNINVRLLMAASFASVLLESLDCLSFIVNLWSETGAGKTVALMAAASIWGDPGLENKIIMSSNHTINSFMNRVSFLYSLPAFFDETQLIKQRHKNFDEFIYTLTEGIGRGRLNREGNAKKILGWKNLSIFTGEEPLTHDQSGGGAVNRVIDIRAYDKLFENPREVANVLRNNFGHAGRTYIEYIQKFSKTRLQEMYGECITHLEQLYGIAGKQIHSLACLVLADQLAVACIFKGEEHIKLESLSQFIKNQSEVSVAERAYEMVKNWIICNMNRFKTDNNLLEVWGDIRGGYAYVDPNKLKEFLRSNQFNFDAIKKEWADKGYLIKDSQGKYTISTTLAGFKSRYIKVSLENENNESATNMLESFKQCSIADTPFA